MRCDECEHWTLSRQTHYEDGSAIATFTAPSGKGHCDLLNLDTAPEFGCTSFRASNIHVVITHKAGAPWQHFKMGPCPDCSGAGSSGSACHRCAGTGIVRYYDDGFVGEEQHRLHPKEKELKAKGEPLPPINPTIDGTVLAKIKAKEDFAGDVL